MAGIPAADLAEWQSRKARGGASTSNNGQPPSKKPKVESVALTPEQLKAQLEAHKALMSGASTSTATPEASSSSSSTLPFHPGVPGAPSGPGGQRTNNPIGYGGNGGYAGGLPPPQMYGGPPPMQNGFGMPPRPNFPGGPPPNMMNQGFNGYQGPPPSGFGGPVGYQGGPPTAPFQGQRQWGNQPPPSNPSLPPQMYQGPPPINPSIPKPSQFSPHQIAIRTGAKSRMVYTDKEISPEEKLAGLGKYRYVDPDDPVTDQAEASTAAHPIGVYQGPPPSINNQFNQNSPYQMQQQPHQFNAPPSHPQKMWPQRSDSSSASPAANASLPTNHNPHQSPPAQSYPAIPPNALPPSAQPQANTAEAIQQGNFNAGNENGMGGGTERREKEVGAMIEGAKEEKIQSVVSSSSSSQEVAANEGTIKGRKRAADLF